MEPSAFSDASVLETDSILSAEKTFRLKDEWLKFVALVGDKKQKLTFSLVWSLNSSQGNTITCCFFLAMTVTFRVSGRDPKSPHHCRAHDVSRGAGANPPLETKRERGTPHHTASI